MRRAAVGLAPAGGGEGLGQLGLGEVSSAPGIPVRGRCGPPGPASCCPGRRPAARGTYLGEGHVDQQQLPGADHQVARLDAVGIPRPQRADQRQPLVDQLLVDIGAPISTAPSKCSVTGRYSVQMISTMPWGLAAVIPASAAGAGCSRIGWRRTVWKGARPPGSRTGSSAISCTSGRRGRGPCRAWRTGSLAGRLGPQPQRGGVG
jgi:hypothetical protein